MGFTCRSFAGWLVSAPVDFQGAIRVGPVRMHDLCLTSVRLFGPAHDVTGGGGSSMCQLPIQLADTSGPHRGGSLH
jgi:hypothetical protein